MDIGDVEMVDAEKNVLDGDPTVQLLIGSVHKWRYDKGSIGISNLYDKKDDQSDSKGDNLIKVISDIENQLNPKSQYETHENVVCQEKIIYEAQKVVKMSLMENENLNKICKKPYY